MYNLTPAMGRKTSSVFFFDGVFSVDCGWSISWGAEVVERLRCERRGRRPNLNLLSAHDSGNQRTMMYSRGTHRSQRAARSLGTGVGGHTQGSVRAARRPKV
jgi:hypothetical protein